MNLCLCDKYAYKNYINRNPLQGLVRKYVLGKVSSSPTKLIVRISI